MAISNTDRLSVAQVARVWVEEAGKKGPTLAELRKDLMTAVLDNDFEFLTPMNLHGTSDPRLYNDPRSRTGIPLPETYLRDGTTIRASEVGNYFRATHVDVETADARAADAILLSGYGIWRWCYRDGFKEWSKARHLRAPKLLRDLIPERAFLDLSKVPSKSPKSSSSYSEAKLSGWYIKRFKNWPDGTSPPSRDEDLRDARAAFGPSISRDAIRTLRRKAPPTWHKTTQKRTATTT